MNGVVGMTSWAQLKSPRPPRYIMAPGPVGRAGVLLSIDESTMTIDEARLCI